MKLTRNLLIYNKLLLGVALLVDFVIESVSLNSTMTIRVLELSIAVQEKGTGYVCLQADA